MTKHSIAHAIKIMLKILQVRLQQYENFQMYNLDLEKAKELEIKLPTFIGSQRKQRNSRKTSTSVLLTTLKPLTMCIISNLPKIGMVTCPVQKEGRLHGLRHTVVKGRAWT